MINVGHIEGFGAGMKDAFLFYINSNGSWGNLGPTYGGVLNDGLKSIVGNSNNGYCLAGLTQSYSVGNEDVLLIRVDSVVLNPDTTIDSFFDMIPLNVLTKTNKEPRVLIYPNPVINFFNFKTKEKINTIFIFNNLGVKIKEVIVSRESSVDVSALNKGMYHILFFENGHLKNSQAIIKQ